MTNRVRYTKDNVLNSRFYQMPKFLFDEEFKDMSNDARVLYSLLKDRHELSISNNWVNENNEVYLIYSRKNMGEMLGLSDKTTKKAVDQLIKFDLIEEERKGQGKPNHIFLKAVSIDNTMNRRNSDSGNGQTPSQESEEFRPNDTDINDTDISDTIFLSTNKNDEEEKSMDNSKDERKKESNTKSVNEFKQILSNSNYKIYDDSNAILLALRSLYYRDKPLKVGDMSIPPAQIREDLKLLQMEHIDYGLSDFEKQSKEQVIKHPAAYLAMCIYNAIFQGDLKLKSKVNYNEYVSLNKELEE